MSESTTSEASSTAVEPNTSNEPLGDGGKKALEAERAAAKAATAKAAELQKQLDALNQANETALEKAQREANGAREAAAKATADALRFRIAAKHGISDEDAELFLTGADDATLQRQAARLTERTPATSAPKPDLTQGGSGSPAVALNSNELTDALKAAVGAN